MYVGIYGRACRTLVIFCLPITSKIYYKQTNFLIVSFGFVVFIAAAMYDGIQYYYTITALTQTNK